MDSILALDETIFRLINGSWHGAAGDVLFPILRNKYTWIPAYLALAVYAIIRFRFLGVYCLLGLIAVVAISDTVSHRVIKENVQRLRPCKTEGLAKESRLLLKSCGSGYSFTSNHATNHFAIAVYLLGTLGLAWGRYRWLLLLWAAAIAYAQVYVGVHFPLDVLGGALLGSLIGGLGAYLFRRFGGRF